MVCTRETGCGYVKPCVVCRNEDAITVSKRPSFVRLQETTEQLIRRAKSDHRVVLSRQVFWGSLFVLVVSGALVAFWVVRKRRAPGWVWAVAAVSVVGVGVARWRLSWARDANLAVIAEVKQERLVRLISVKAPEVMPRNHWMHPAFYDYLAEMAHLKQLLEAKHKDWRARAIDAGESPSDY
jgi:hypothetical protein